VTGWFEPWRAEADDAWLADHRGDAFGRIRRIMRFGTGLGTAIADSAAQGFLLSPPRNPTLKVKDITGEQIRYAERQYAFTTVQLVRDDACRRCGGPYADTHRLVFVDQYGGQMSVGAIRKCRRCDADAWLFRSWMPAYQRRAARNARAVL